MAIIKRMQLENYFVQIPNETAKHVETEISLQALGLLTNIMCYSENWELHKTELYSRYKNNKEVSVRRAWKELMSAGYIIEYKYRNGRKWDYVYWVRLLPFSSEEKERILSEARSEHSEIWGLDFEDPKLETSKPRGNQYKETKEESKKEEQPPIDMKSIEENMPLDMIDKGANNDSVEEFDDDKRASSPSENGYTKHNEEDLNIIINSLRDATKDEINQRSFKAVLRKVMDKYNQGRVNSFRDYFVTALVNKIEELELRRMKEQAKSAIKEDKARRSRAKIRQEIEGHEPNWDKVPLYNWLES